MKGTIVLNEDYENKFEIKFSHPADLQRKIKDFVISKNYDWKNTSVFMWWKEGHDQQGDFRYFRKGVGYIQLFAGRKKPI